MTVVWFQLPDLRGAARSRAEGSFGQVFEWSEFDQDCQFSRKGNQVLDDTGEAILGARFASCSNPIAFVLKETLSFS